MKMMLMSGETTVSRAWGDAASGHLHGALVQIEQLLRCGHIALDCSSACGRDIQGPCRLCQFVLDLENG